MNKDEKLLLNVSEAAEILNILRPTVYKLIHQDGFPVVHIGTRTLIHKEKLNAWLIEQIKNKG